ncbi:HAUS augmin-like complex subunit 2 [Polymixia lowei]
MNLWDFAQYSVTPVANILTRCVVNGVLSQEEIDSAPRDSHAFSCHLQEVEQQIKSKKQLDKLQLEVELLKSEKESADVTHRFYLNQRFEAVQQFTSHLQEVLRDQRSLRQRLMSPLCQSSLPVQADLHRYVVEVIRMVVHFIENLETHLTGVRTAPSVHHSMAKLNNALSQLLVLVGEVENLSKQVLQWKSHHSKLLSDSSA